MGMEYGYFNDDTGIGVTVMIFYVLYMLVVIAACVAAYLLQSAGLYSIAKRRGIQKPWLAWVPVVCSWTLGCVSDQYRYVVMGQVKNKRKVMLVLQIILAALMAVFVVLFVTFPLQIMSQTMMPQYGVTGEGAGVVISALGVIFTCFAMYGVAIALGVIQYMALYDLYRSCRPSCGVAFLLVSIFVSAAMPVLLFICRNRDDGMPPRRPEYYEE